jgi:hypothetical protein
MVTGRSLVLSIIESLMIIVSRARAAASESDTPPARVTSLRPGCHAVAPGPAAAAARVPSD